MVIQEEEEEELFERSVKEEIGDSRRRRIFLRYSTSNFFHLSEEDSLLCVDPERETPRENQL